MVCHEARRGFIDLHARRAYVSANLQVEICATRRVKAHEFAGKTVFRKADTVSLYPGFKGEEIILHKLLASLAWQPRYQAHRNLGSGQKPFFGMKRHLIRIIALKNLPLDRGDHIKITFRVVSRDRMVKRHANESFVVG